MALASGLTGALAFGPKLRPALASDSLIPNTTSSTNGDGLKDLVPPGFQIGTQMMRKYEGQPDLEEYRNTIKREFNLIYSAASMYVNVHPSRDSQNDWGHMDELVDFSSDNNIQMRGISLINHWNLPAWFSGLSMDEAKTQFFQYISEVVSRYANKKCVNGNKVIPSWVVVDEAFKDGSQTDEFRDEDILWSKFPTSDEKRKFIRDAFMLTKGLDPALSLMYSDTQAEMWSDPKTHAVYDFVLWLQSQGDLISSVGMNGSFPVVNPNIEVLLNQIGETIANLEQIGMESQMTQFSSWFRECDGTLDDQATMYASMLNLALSHSNSNAFVMEGFTDKYHTIRDCDDPNATEYSCTCPGMPGPAIFDENFNPKPAYFALRDTLLTARAQGAPRVREFVISRYNAMIEYLPNDKEVLQWTETLQSGKETAQSLILHLHAMPEFVATEYNHSDYLDFIYRKVLGRRPDSNGKEFFLGMLGNGITREAIAGLMTSGQEFENKYKGYWMKAA